MFDKSKVDGYAPYRVLTEADRSRIIGAAVKACEENHGLSLLDLLVGATEAFVLFKVGCSSERFSAE